MPLIQSSTRDLFSEGRRTKGYSWFDFVHGYAYARWPYLYIGIGTQEHPSSVWVVPLVNGIARLFGAFSGGGTTCKRHGGDVPWQGGDNGGRQTAGAGAGADRTAQPRAHHSLSTCAGHCDHEPGSHRCSGVPMPCITTQSLPAPGCVFDRW